MKNTKKLIVCGLLSAIIIVMALTPIGYLKIGVVEITFLTIPVIVGAILLGSGTGAFLGFVFGATSFAQALFGQSAFGAQLMAINPIYCAVMCIIPRVLMGFLCGVIFKAFGRQKNAGTVRFVISSLCGAVFNTVFFVSALIILFGKSDYIMSMRGGAGLFAFVAAFVGINSIIEAVVCAIAGTAVTKALYKSFNAY